MFQYKDKHKNISGKIIAGVVVSAALGALATVIYNMNNEKEKDKDKDLNQKEEESHSD